MTRREHSCKLVECGLHVMMILKVMHQEVIATLELGDKTAECGEYDAEVNREKKSSGSACEGAKKKLEKNEA